MGLQDGEPFLQGQAAGAGGPAGERGAEPDRQGEVQRHRPVPPQRGQAGSQADSNRAEFTPDIVMVNALGTESLSSCLMHSNTDIYLSLFVST